MRRKPENRKPGSDPNYPTITLIKKKIDELGSSFPAPNTTKMKGDNSFHKVRSGDYRIIYEIHDDRLVILIVKVGPRKDVYKKLP